MSHCCPRPNGLAGRALSVVNCPLLIGSYKVQKYVMDCSAVLRWLGNIVMFVVSMVLVILFLEWFLRFSALQPMHPDPHVHQPVMTGGLVYEAVPNNHTRGFGRETIITNSVGFRSPEIMPEKPIIAFIGDSMTFGFGVENEETNPAVVGKMFPDYQIANAGVNGYNLEQEVLAYEQKVVPLDPKLVILEFVINDADAKAHYNAQGVLTTEDLTPAQEEERLRRAITAPGTWHIPFKTFLHEQSALFTFIERRTKGMWFRAKTSIFSKKWSPDMKQYYQTWFERLTKDMGSRPKLFVIWMDGWLHPETDYWVETLARKQGWLVLNLGEYFGMHYQTLGWDHHPSVAVQRQAGELMGEFVVREGLLR